MGVLFFEKIILSNNLIPDFYIKVTNIIQYITYIFINNESIEIIFIHMEYICDIQ